MLLLLGWLLELVTSFRVASQLEQDAEEVHAVHEDDESHWAIKSPDTGLPRHPAAKQRDRPD